MNAFKDVQNMTVGEERFFSATHEEILRGATTDVYFVKTRDVLRYAGKLETPVTAEVFAQRAGIFAGSPEVLHLFKGKPLHIEALPEGVPFEAKETVMRIRGPYGDFGMHETVLLGMLASASAWATAARECVEAAAGKPVLCFGARHVHPSVAPVMERTALAVGGCTGASCILGAKLVSREPMGTVPHAAALIMGDTVDLARAYDGAMPEDDARIVLVDTFKDEAEESLRVARALGGRLAAIRLDTPGERGGVTPALVREVRQRLNLEGYSAVKIIVSGGLSPDRIRELAEAGADSFGVGSYISHAKAIDMTMDIKEIDGRPFAKRGRIPGITPNPSLVVIEEGQA